MFWGLKFDGSAQHPLSSIPPARLVHILTEIVDTGLAANSVAAVTRADSSQCTGLCAFVR